MIRLIRLVLYFAIGLLLGGLFSFAHAETIPATMESQSVAVKWRINQQYFYSPEDTCQGYAQTQNTTQWQFVSRVGNTVNCRILGWIDVAIPGDAYCEVGAITNGVCPDRYACPSSGNWSLVGANCVRPDTPCESSQINRDGVCVCDPAHLASFPTAYGSGMEGTGSAPSSSCVGGCMRNAGSFCLGGGGTWWCEGGAWTTQKCSGGATDKPKPENKKPPCAANEGVMTSSSGTVACVPEGTPNARKPVVEKTQQKTTGPNGETETSEKTKTTDPATNTSHTSSTTTNSTGTTTKETESGGDGKGGVAGDNSGDEPGDCAKEPDSPICKKGEVKEKGEFGDGQDAELEAAKGELRAKFAEIKAAASSLFGSGSSSAGGGGLPCYPPVMILGRAFSLCFSQYADKLAPIGGFLIFAASLLAVFIVLRR